MFDHSDFLAHSMFTSDVCWGSLGTSIFGNSSSAANNTWSRLPSRLPFRSYDCVTIDHYIAFSKLFFYHLHINQTIILWTIVIIWGYFLIWTCLGLLNWVHVLTMLVDVFVIDETSLCTNTNSTYFTVFCIIIYIIPLLTTAYSYEVSE